MTLIQEYRTAILSGKFNAEELNEIANAIRQRREIEESEMKNTLKVGQTVWFNIKVRPHYLAGVEATITKINSQRVVVTLKNPTAGGRFGSQIRSSVSILTTVRPDYAKPISYKTAREPFSITKKDVGQMPPGIV